MKSALKAGFEAGQKIGQEIELSAQEIETLCGISNPVRELLAVRLREQAAVGDFTQSARDVLESVVAQVAGIAPVGLSSAEIDSSITIFDARYPALLREIYAPPPVLFVRGALASAGAAARPVRLAIVGARKAGLRVCGFVERLAEQLAARGVAIVSGLAYGIDAAAHRGALACSEGVTIAVLGTPLERIYPAAHLGLAEQIVEQGGTIISEWPSGVRVFPSNFLQRNRIIAGMCQGVIVAQAGERSGSLATARFALEENRDVMALPGDVLDEAFAGSNRLIREGATLVTAAEQILQNYENMLAPPRKESGQAAAGRAQSGMSPPWLAALPIEPIDRAQFFSMIPAQHDPHETLLTLELSGLVAVLPGGEVQRIR